MRASFFWRLYLGCVALIVLSTVSVELWTERLTDQDMRRDLFAAVRARTVLLADLARPALQGHDSGDLDARIVALGRDTGARLTLVRADGVVIADSERSPAVMDNHLHRPEIQDALEHGEGSAERLSDTTGVRYQYVARSVSDGATPLGFVRAAVPLSEIDRRIAELRSTFAWTAVVASGLAVVVALYFARRISAPLSAMTELAEGIARGDYRRVAMVDGADEIRRLSGAIGSMTAQLEGQLATITSDRNKLVAVLSSMVEGVIAVDGDERVLHLNAVAGRLLDIDPQQALGRRVWELTRVRPVCEILEAARASSAERHLECRARIGTGEVVLELRAAPLRDGSGALAGAVVALHDVTALRKLETMRRDFVANVSHELKTPLTAIRGMVETMLDDRAMPEETAKRFLERVREQSSRLTALVADLLTLARIESNEGRPERRLIDMRGVLRESSSRFSDVATRRGLVLTVELPKEPLVLLSDDESLRQIVDNLLDNACKYTPSGGRVTLRLARGEREATLEVQDTGIGIEARDQERVFERFYRVDKARSRELGGTGLGLAIVKHLAQSLNGRVSLESLVGRGSTFRVHLPFEA